MRELFSVVVTSLLAGWFALPAVADKISVEVSETAGVRRAPYPVSVAVRSQGVPLSQRNVQVLLEGTPLPAQVDAAPSEYKRGTYLVDFHATFVPFQSRRFRIRFGEGVQGSPLPEHGHVLQETDDRITTTSAGQLQVVRSYVKGSTPPTGKQLRSWLHFVFYPPQVSAATCPQAMQNPLTVKIVD